MKYFLTYLLFFVFALNVSGVGHADAWPVVEGLAELGKITREAQKHVGQFFRLPLSEQSKKISEMVVEKKETVANESHCAVHEFLHTPLQFVRNRVERMKLLVKKIIQAQLDRGFRAYVIREIKRGVSASWKPALKISFAVLLWYLAMQYSLHVHREAVKKGLADYFVQNSYLPTHLPLPRSH